MIILSAFDNAMTAIRNFYLELYSASLIV
jgi:hypothetical protein